MYDAVEPSAAAPIHARRSTRRPGRAGVHAAVRDLLLFIGEDPDRDGLRDTPSRVVRAFEEYFSGYGQDPGTLLGTSFEETGGYDELVVLRGVPFVSHCEHHLAPIVGRAWVAYQPRERVVGISKLARVVDAFARRLQIQERLTAQIADTVARVIQPAGTGVVIKAMHYCMMARGVQKHGTDLVTCRLTGSLRDDPVRRSEFMALVNGD